MTARERVDPLAITGHTAATPAESTLLATTSLEDLRRAILGDAADDGVDRGELFEAVEAQLRGLRADVGLDPIVRAPASELGASSPSLTASQIGRASCRERV